ncbi:MAG TPA: S41 family peptidase [Candidatus Saccharimonadales bacterium]|nr:S41 family peptidase [Candidatus Saccharimonadales bacterium]
MTGKTNTKFIRNLIILILIFAAGVLVGGKNPGILDNLDSNRTTQNSSLPNRLDYSGVEEVYSKLRANFDGQLDQKKLEDGLKQGLVNAAGDPYTEYLNAQDTKDFNDELNGTFEGIGAELGKKDQSIVIVSPIAGFPAAKAGLKPKDVISDINGQSAFDISISEAVQKIRGPKGSKVKLGVIRDGKKLEFSITRAKITVPSVSEKVVGGVGVIKIIRFGDDTVNLARKYANDLNSKHVKGVVLDLRGNPGGLLDAAVGVSSLWLDKGDTVLQEKRGGIVEKTYFAEGNPVLGGIPTVVLIDAGSASASEITAGALHDNGVATLIGTKSYGKGSVQEVLNLDDGGELKVTVARWYTPKGRNIDKEGIKPDKTVKFTQADSKAGRDPQQDAAIQNLK